MQDHYQVLNIALTADSDAIKKAYRKLALQYHPDKSGGSDEALNTFRQVQQAYECLSDPGERKWYDEHREAILRGWSVSEGDGDKRQQVEILFDVVPFMHAGCFNGFGDDEAGFFRVYTKVFSQIFKQEEEGWVMEGNIDAMPQSDLPTDYGTGSTEWSQVATFYKTWESFSSCRAFAWADRYNVRDAEDRRMRRAMEDENKKARRVAKRRFNDDILALVHFVKRRDPRVKTQKVKVEQEKLAKKEAERKELEQRKQKTQQEREQWKHTAEEHMARLEEEDRNAGRVRLADLDDDFYFGGGKGKKGRKKNKQIDLFYEFGEEDLEYNLSDEEKELRPETDEEGNAVDQSIDPKSLGGDENDVKAVDADNVTKNGITVEALVDETVERAHEVDNEDELEEEDPEVFRCECCRKDFKSVGQFDNHVKSKKHKEAYKKWDRDQRKTQKVNIEQLLDELAMQP